MSLLDRVVSGDEAGILCLAASHRDPRNPLRRGDRLPITVGAEYAAQAIALHAALTGVDREPRRGYLAVVNNLSWTRDRLDDIAGDLEVRARQLASTGAALQYAVSITAGGEVLLSGELMVALEKVKGGEA
jgi:predicted hotdog family 3-hydroxylacyl-ACP dehydratase